MVKPVGQRVVELAEGLDVAPSQPFVEFMHGCSVRSPGGLPLGLGVPHGKTDRAAVFSGDSTEAK